jgi:RNA polymerase sigma-70 factor (ECF subfamily)
VSPIAETIATASALRQNWEIDGDVTVFEDDQEIIARFLRREAESARAIESWIARAASPFRRRLGSNWEDLLQEVTLEITRLLEQGSFRGEARLKTYIWRVTTHACLKQIRAQNKAQWLDLDSIVEKGGPPELSPLNKLLEKESVGLLLRVMERTTDECRGLWRLILAGLSYQEISRQMDASEGALRVKALRCRKRAVALRDELLAKKEKIMT